MTLTLQKEGEEMDKKYFTFLEKMLFNLLLLLLLSLFLSFSFFFFEKIYKEEDESKEKGLGREKVQWNVKKYYLNF